MAHQRLARSLFWQTRAADAYDILKSAKKIDRENAAKNKTREASPLPEAIMAQYYEQFEGRDVPDRERRKWFKALLKMPRTI